MGERLPALYEVPLGPGAELSHPPKISSHSQLLTFMDVCISMETRKVSQISHYTAGTE